MDIIDPKRDVEELLPGYFSGELGEESRVMVEEWKNASNENKREFLDFKRVWEAGEKLALMKQFNADKALQKVHDQVFRVKRIAIGNVIKKVAAVLVIPLLVYSGYVTLQFEKQKNLFTSEAPSWTEVSTTTGMQSKLTLPDGSEVWLNSATNLKYPSKFGKYREVEICGEAFFEVQKDDEHPFIVKTGKINIEVTGTSFNVLNYPEEIQTEVVLKSGEVKLFSGDVSDKNEISVLKPGQKATYIKNQGKVFINNTYVEKHTAWMEGKLMFVDDPMEEVVRKLNRWFNVEIVLQDTDLHEYVYKATFEDETLDQILELLKLSAPIEYTSNPRKLMPDGTFSKRKVIIKKRHMK